MGQPDPAGAAGPVGIVLDPPAPELLAERRPYGGGQHGDAIRVALATADGDLAQLEVEILDPEPQALEEPEAGSVQEGADQARRAVEAVEHAADLAPAEHDGHAGGRAGPDEVAQRVGRTVEDVAIEEEERAQGLGLGGRADARLRGQLREEGGDVGFAQLGGMAEAMVADEAADPADVGFLGAAAVVPELERAADGGEEPGRRGARRGR